MGWTEDAERLVASVVDPATLLLEAVVELTGAQGSFEDVAPLLAELVCAVANADGATVSLVDGAEIVAVAGTGLLTAAPGSRNRREGSLAGIVVATGTPQLAPDVAADTRVDRDACARLGIASMAIMPIRQQNHTHALVMLASSQSGAISQDQVDLVEPLLRTAAIKFAQVSAAESAASQLALLQDITEASRSVLVAEDPGQCLVDAIAEIVRAEHAYLLLPDDDGKLVVSKFHGHDLTGMVSAADDSTISGSAYSTRRPKLIADWTTHPAASEELAAGALGGARSGVYIPLLTVDGAVGVVAALLPAPLTAANAEMLGLLQLLAAEAGIAITRDVLRRTLSDQARTDSLTGIANRRVWIERMDIELSKSGRGGPFAAVAILDLDFFKRYNDSLGHPAGDALLVAAAKAWAKVLRPTDLLARLGGEEFGVLLPDTDLDTAAGIVERLRAEVPANQTASIGLTLLVIDDDASTALARADEALYDAKETGRNRICTK